MATDKLAQLQSAFPNIDAVNITETLEACDGDVARTSEVLHAILEEEAAEAATLVPSPLLTLIDAVTAIASLPVAAQPAESRSRVLAACSALEARGIHLLALVTSILALACVTRQCSGGTLT